MSSEKRVGGSTIGFIISPLAEGGSLEIPEGREMSSETPLSDKARETAVGMFLRDPEGALMHLAYAAQDIERDLAAARLEVDGLIEKVALERASAAITLRSWLMSNGLTPGPGESVYDLLEGVGGQIAAARRDAKALRERVERANHFARDVLETLMPSPDEDSIARLMMVQSLRRLCEHYFSDALAADDAQRRKEGRE
jgi:hypothetical protein